MSEAKHTTDLLAALKVEVQYLELAVCDLSYQGGTKEDRAWRSNAWAHANQRLERARADIAKAEGRA